MSGKQLTMTCEGTQGADKNSAGWGGYLANPVLAGLDAHHGVLLIHSQPVSNRWSTLMNDFTFSKE